MTMAAHAAQPQGAGGFAVLLTASLLSSLIMLDSNVVAVALPAIGQSLHAGFNDVQWVINAYVLTYAALLLGGGAYADLYGRRQAMVIGLVVFALSSAACGLASSILYLNVARALQGVGGAFLPPFLGQLPTGTDQSNRSAIPCCGSKLARRGASGPLHLLPPQMNVRFWRNAVD